MSLSPLQPPPADPEIARRLLATTAFEVPPLAVLQEVVPWTLHEAKMAVHRFSGQVEVITFTLVPEWLRPEEERILRTSGAGWHRPAALPPAVLEAARHELERWRRQRGLEPRSASVVARAEHGYRMRFRTESEELCLDLAVSPPRIVREERTPVARAEHALVGAVRRLGRASWTLIAGGAASS